MTIENQHPLHLMIENNPEACERHSNQHQNGRQKSRPCS